MTGVASPAWENVERAKRYIEALEQGVTGEALGRFFTFDALLEEFPNRLSPQGGRRDVFATLEAAERGRKIMAVQRFHLVNAVASGDDVALEVEWTGQLAVPAAGLAAGAEMRARFAVFLEFRDGRIARQRNYDCFDPW